MTFSIRIVTLLLFFAGFVYITPNWGPETSRVAQMNSSYQITQTSANAQVNTPKASSTVTPFPQVVSTPDPQIDELRKDLEEIRNQQYQEIISQAQSATDYANLLIQWSGFLFTVFAFIIAVAGFLGFREYQLVRNQYVELERMRHQFMEHVREIEVLESSFENRYNELAEKFEQQSRTFMEASYYFSLGEKSYKEGDFQNAIVFFKWAAKLLPGDVRLLCRIGRAYTEMDKSSDALVYFNEALKVDPNNSIALRGISIGYRFEKPEKALEYAIQATEANHDDGDAYDFLGLIYRDVGQIDDAIKCHEKALQLRLLPESYFFLGLLYAFRQEHERSKFMLLSAKLELERQEKGEVLGEQTRRLWKLLIRFCQEIADNNRTNAIELAKEMGSFMTTPRAIKSVWGHVEFLLSSLGQEESISAYEAILPRDGS